MTNGEGILKNQLRELTPQNDVKKVVSEVLKRVDGFIRKGELDQAEHCVLQAREIDPKNIYAYAFQERITILKDQVYQNSLAAAACKSSEETKRIDQVCVQTNTNQSQKGQPKPQSTPQPVLQTVSQNLSTATSKKDAEPKLTVRDVPKPNNIGTAQKEQPTNQFMKMFNWKSSYTEYLIIGAFVMLFLISLYYIFKKEKDTDF